MLRARIALSSALLLGAAPFAPPSHAVECSPLTADVCATYVFACERLAYHDIHLKLCQIR